MFENETERKEGDFKTECRPPAPNTHENNEPQCRRLLSKLPSVEDMQQCIATGTGKNRPEPKADDTTGGGAQEAPGAASAAGAATGAIARSGAAGARTGADTAPGDDRSTTGASASAGGGEADVAEGAGPGREPSEEAPPALKRTFPEAYPLLRWLLSKWVV